MRELLFSYCFAVVMMYNKYNAKAKEDEMKREINHICGHTETVQVYGTNVHGEQDRKVAWMASQPCRDCKRAAQREATAKWEAEWGFAAEMDGSAKQVAWARDIRRDKLEGWMPRMRAEMVEAFAAWTCRKGAKWWIDGETSGKLLTGKNVLMAYMAEEMA